MDEKLPASTSLRSLTLTTHDLPELETYYRDGLGLQVIERSPDSLSLGAEGGDALLHLVADPNAPVPPERSAGLYHFAILLPERRALAGVLKHLITGGVRLDGAADHLVSEALYLTDPQGNGIEIYADRPRETWQIENGQMKMGTLPLDIDGLLSESDQPLEKIPTGTNLGHMHLHVSELEPAVEFYERLVGFDLMLKYGPSAAFLSAGGYHHHLGLNTWQGEGAPKPPSNAVGLREYSITVREAHAWSALKARMAVDDSAGETEPDRFSVTDPSGHVIVFMYEGA